MAKVVPSCRKPKIRVTSVVDMKTTNCRCPNHNRSRDSRKRDEQYQQRQHPCANHSGVGKGFRSSQSGSADRVCWIGEVTKHDQGKDDHRREHHQPAHPRNESPKACCTCLNRHSWKQLPSHAFHDAACVFFQLQNTSGWRSQVPLQARVRRIAGPT